MPETKTNNVDRRSFLRGSAVFAAALSHGKAIEINASPDRLDMSDVHARRAAELGIPVAINTDTHYLANLEWTQLGCAVARRAWIGPDQVLNARPLAERGGALLLPEDELDAASVAERIVPLLLDDKRMRGMAEAMRRGFRDGAGQIAAECLRFLEGSGGRRPPARARNG